MSKSSKMVRGNQASVPVLDPDHVEEVEAAPLSEEAVMQGLAIAGGTAVSQETPDSNSTALVDNDPVGSPGEPPLVQENVLATISHEMSSPNNESVSTLRVLRIPEKIIPLIHLDVPMMACSLTDQSYVPRHIELKMSYRQAKALHGLSRGLCDSGKETDARGYKKTFHPKDSLLWLLDRIADVQEGVSATAANQSASSDSSKVIE